MIQAFVVSTLSVLSIPSLSYLTIPFC